MPRIIIDTNIFKYAFVVPKDQEYLDIHQKANRFFIRMTQDREVRVLITSYQAAEIQEVFRKVGADKSTREMVFRLLNSGKFVRKDLTWEYMEKSFQLSLSSGIHIYDYLVVTPFENDVDEIYSADEHFQHQDFTALAPVRNPISGWVLIEGRIPQRKTQIADQGNPGSSLK